MQTVGLCTSTKRTLGSPCHQRLYTHFLSCTKFLHPRGLKLMDPVPISMNISVVANFLLSQPVLWWIFEKLSKNFSGPNSKDQHCCTKMHCGASMGPAHRSFTEGGLFTLPSRASPVAFVTRLKLIQFSFSGTITDTLPQFHNLDGFKVHSMSMIKLLFSVWLLSLGMFIHVVTCISTSFFSLCLNTHNIYHSNHFNYALKNSMTLTTFTFLYK